MFLPVVLMLCVEFFLGRACAQENSDYENSPTRTKNESELCTFAGIRKCCSAIHHIEKFTCAESEEYLLDKLKDVIDCELKNFTFLYGNECEEKYFRFFLNPSADELDKFSIVQNGSLLWVEAPMYFKVDRYCVDSFGGNLSAFVCLKDEDKDIYFTPGKHFRKI